MTESVLKEIVHRAVRDGSFRAQLKSDPAGALAGFSLTSEERSAIASGDPTRLTALGIDQRMSKAFTVGVVGDASKVIVVDAGASGASVIDETAASMSPMWRIERDLDVGGTASAAPIDGSPEAAAFEAAPTAFSTGSAAPIDGSPEAAAFENAAATGGTEHSPMWRIEQDLDAGSSLQATDEGATEGTQVEDNDPGDTHLADY